jgi:hypothetical protein
MSSNSIQQPYDIIIHPTGGGGRCKPVSNGLYHVGEINKDPKLNPKQDIVYVDEAGTVVSISSPIQLNASGAFVVSKHDGTIISPFLTESVGYSVLIEDSNGNEIYKSAKFGSDDDISALVSNKNVIPNPFLEIPGSVANPPDETPRNYNEGDELFKGHFAHTSLTDVKFVDGVLSGLGQIRVDVDKGERLGAITTLFAQSRATANGAPTQAGTTLESYDDKFRVIYDVEGTFSVKLEQGGTPTKHQYESTNSLQFAPYDENRIYTTGETCITTDSLTKEVYIWQWYSNVEFLAGKNPTDPKNRHEEWTDTNKPFYWIPYTGNQVGMPFFWLNAKAPEWAVMEINVDLPISVYWRLARRYPDLVSGNFINTGEIRAAAIRVLDQGRGIDQDRAINTEQLDAFQGHTFADSTDQSQKLKSVTNQATSSLVSSSGRSDARFASVEPGVEPVISTDGTNGEPRVDSETRMRNVARPMAIAI